MTPKEQEEPARSEAERRSEEERRRSEVTIPFPDRRADRSRRGPSVRTQVYEEGEVILQEGALGNQVYTITSGMVEVSVQSDGDMRVLAMLGPGEIFGEMGLIEDRPRSATVKALERTSVKIIDRETFAYLYGRNPKVLMPIIKALFERLRIANARLAELMAKPGVVPEVEEHCVVTIEGATSQIQNVIGKGPLEITHLPFRVGRYDGYAVEDVLEQNDLMLEDEIPYQLSRNHFAIDWVEDGIWIVDRGSRLGTIVNGKRIGGKGEVYMMALNEGKNKITAGVPSSPFRFVVTVGL